MTPIVGKPTCPAFWLKFCIEFLGTDAKTAKLLWDRYYPSHDLLWQLLRVDNLLPGSLEKFAELVTPASLLAATERVVKDQGRTKALIALEEMICQRTDSRGGWV